MADPLGLISGSGGIDPARFVRPSAGPNAADGPTFRETLQSNLNEVNRLQEEANMAVEDLQTGDRKDVEDVLLATTKADNAFRMLQALRNRMMEAYDEIKQMRT